MLTWAAVELSSLGLRLGLFSYLVSLVITFRLSSKCLIMPYFQLHSVINESFSWLFFSVARLRRVLSCYDPSVPVVLGERYGFNVHHSQGYNYITGGGGTVFSAAVLMKLTNEGTFACRCPSDSSPDDMYLGMCLKKMGMTVTHSPLFHQVRVVFSCFLFTENKSSITLTTTFVNEQSCS